MGTSWSAQIVMPAGGMPRGIEAALKGELDRVVAAMSHWQPDSAISRFNRSMPGSWQALPPELLGVLKAGLGVAEASGGAFDPAMGLPATMWGFGPSGPVERAPDDDTVARALAASGKSAIELDMPLLRARRMRAATLDFSGIAKGHAVDRLAAQLRTQGLLDFLVEIGGEFVGAGLRPDGQPWWVDAEPVPGAALPPLRVALHERAIATSGDYRRSFAADGTLYSHTIDPRTGRPIANGVASVTVIHIECMLADAWATALTVAGPEAGAMLAEREGLAMQMVVREGEGYRQILSPALGAMLI